MKILHDAFLSYSHQADRALAPVLEQGMERMAKPTFKLRAIDVFRDQTSLAANPGVWSGILEHLSGARWLIFLASPGSAVSPWCQKELRWWMDNHGSTGMLVVLTDGEIVWNEEARDFDWTQTTALPQEVLAGRLEEPPLYVDLRWVRNVGSLDARDPRLRAACLDLVAPVRGVPKDKLDGDDVRELRRTRWIARSGAALITLAAAVATWQAIEATRQRRQAELEARISRAEAMAANAQLALMQATELASKERAERPDVDRSALLALESLHLHPGLAADSVLRLALFALGGRLTVTLGPGDHVSGISPQGEIIRAQSGESTINQSESINDELAHSSGGHWWLRRSDEGVTDGVPQTGALSRSADGPPLALLPHEWMIRRAAFTNDGRWLVTVTGTASADAAEPSATVLVGDTVRVWDVEGQTERTRISLKSDGGIAEIWVDPTGEWLATLSENDEHRLVRLWPIRPDRLQVTACSLLKRNLSPSEWRTFVGNSEPNQTCPGLPVISE